MKRNGMGLNLYTFVTVGIYIANLLLKKIINTMPSSANNIVDFGAIADSDKLQTAAIQAAIDAAFLAGGGEVVVPEGVFRT